MFVAPFANGVIVYCLNLLLGVGNWCSWINSPPKMVNPPLFCCIVLNIVNNNNNLKKKTKVQNTRPHPNAQNVHNGET
jgi:hypothetical protein